MSFPFTFAIPNPPSYWERHQDVQWPPRSGNKAASVHIHKIAGLQVLRSISTMQDGSQWLHVSVARRSRMPEYNDLTKVKKDFIGEDVEAYMVMAKAADHVNIHQFCLHLWAPSDPRLILPANLQRISGEVAV